MHTETKKTSSNTEWIFFLPQGFFNTQPIPLTSLITSTLSVHKKEREKKIHTRDDEEYAKCSETSIINVKGGFVTLTKHLKYLGSYISYYLQDDYDIDAHLAAGNESMEALARFWTDASVDNHIKYLIFFSISINMLLWVCES